MAPTSSSLLAQVARSASGSLLSSASTSSSRTMPIFRRSFVLLASRRSAFPHPRRPFPSELLLPSLNSSSSVSAFSTSSPALSRATAEAAEVLEEDADDIEASETIPDSKVPFSSLEGKIHQNTLKAITVRPFKHTHLSPVQEQILPLLPDLALPHDHSDLKATSNTTPRDLLVKAKTGTGKTMAFLVPAIESRLKSVEAHADAELNKLAGQGVAVQPADRSRIINRFATENVGALIISPTRELATQIAVEAQNLTMHHRGFGVQLLLGGESRSRQLRNWYGRKDLVVATPGRLMDLMEEPMVRDAIQGTRHLVLDEADTLLDLGFMPAVESISENLPKSPERQTFLFSATVSRKIEEIARKFLSRNHRFVNCVSEDDSPVHAHIPQYHTLLPKGEDALPHLLRLIAHDQLLKQKEAGSSKIVVFFSTTKMVQLFADLLRASAQALPCGRHTSIYEMHSKRDMDRRVATSNAFRKDLGPGSILVTSDVSARGVDYPGVTRVIQMGLPSSKDMYIHRVGRTGRGGKTDGRGDLVLSPWEIGFLQRRMQDVGLKPVTVDGLRQEVEELAKEVVPVQRSSYGRRSAPAAQSYLPTFTTLDSFARETTAGIESQDYSDAFMSQLGFYAGHTENLAIRMDDALEGCGKFFQELGALPGPPGVSRSMMERLKLGEFAKRGGSRRGGGGRPAWGSYATGSNSRGLGRNERQRSPWESGGSGFRGDQDSPRSRMGSRFGGDGERRGSGGNWDRNNESSYERREDGAPRRSFGAGAGKAQPAWLGRGRVSRR